MSITIIFSRDSQKGNHLGSFRLPRLVLPPASRAMSDVQYDDSDIEIDDRRPGRSIVDGMIDGVAAELSPESTVKSDSLANEC